MARVLFTLAILVAAAAAGPLDEARERIANGSVEQARAAVDALAAADTGAAVKALHQGVEAVLRRVKREQDDFEKKTKEFVDFQDTIIAQASKIVELIAAGKMNTPEYKALHKKQEQARAKNAKLGADQAVARAKLTASETIALAALAGFRRFRSDDAVAAIERIAAARAGRVSRACTGALASIGAERSLPVLADLSRAVDVEQRAMAARGLRGGDGTALAKCFGDKAWEVRYAAYEAAAASPPAVSIPLLVDARAKAADEDHVRIDLLLSRLTGVPTADWKAWWEGNGDAVRDGSFRAATGPPPPGELCAGVPLRSRRVSLVFACYSSVPRERDADGKLVGEERPSLFPPAREEMKRAVAAIPDGTTFGIVASRSDSLRPARASDATRRAAAEWLDKLREPHPGMLTGLLTRILVAEPDMVGDVDTVVLVSVSGRESPADAVDVLAAKLGERTEGPVVHCVAVGDMYEEYLLASVALQTGGAFVGGDTPLAAKLPAPGADRWTAGSVRVAAYRELRGGGKEREALASLASIGEEAYPLLPMVLSCLESNKPDDVRIEALAVLGAMGPWAKEGVPRIESLAGASPEVAKAAQAALEKISGK